MTIHTSNSIIELSPAEQHKLLVEWNNTQTDYPKDKCIHQLFEEQVERIPNAIAVIFENQPLTYYELNRRANQLAHHLQSLGVAPEVLVGICVERCLEMVVGLLAILKAGGAYVPLDPNYPKERLAFMLADSQVPVLLTQEKLIEDLPFHQAQIVCLETSNGNLSEENPINRVTQENLAYVIYTSGSTGKPKGVMIEHKSLVNLSTWHIKAFSIQSTDKATLLANSAFDASVWELWPYLIAGACVIPAHLSTLIEKDIWHWLDENQISISFLPTPIIERYSPPSIPNATHLRLLLTGGDTLHQCPSTLPCPLFNNYGPTENTVVTTSILVKPNVSPSIGKPIHNVQVYIMDAVHQLLPIGTPGELCIAGAGLARAYLNRPELTAEKFIEVDIEGKTERIYKTGDLARWRCDGNLEYLGRIDNQVKIRGFRIELGEIEAVLAQHPFVTENAVIVHDADETDKRLVAYLVPSQGQMIEKKALRTFLIERLPNYMIPAAFIPLAQIPLTPNGKIDRRRLPTPDPFQIKKEEQFIAPRTSFEKALAEIWAEVLEHENIGVHDDFFELGGHSLLATQVLSRLRERFDIEISLHELFESPTIAGLAQHLKNESKAQASRLTAIQPISRQKNLRLSVFQEQLWLQVQINPDIPFYNESAAIHINSTLNIAALSQSLNAIIKRHEILRTTFTMVDGQPVQNIMALPPTLKLPLVDLRTVPKEKRETTAQALANEQAKQLFDLTQAPLVRAILVQLDEAQFRLFVTWHHIVIDGFSLYNIFMPELISFYKAFATGQSSPLPELPIQYADFAYWQRQQTFEAQLSYWKKVLSNKPPRLQLPTDYPRPAKPTYRGAKQNFTLSQSLTTKLKQLNQQEGVTLFMTLLATFNTLLYRYTGQDDMVIGSFADCHNRSELENVMGYFINTLVLRTDMSGNPTFKQLLARVCEVTLGAYSHHDLPFQQLVEVLKPVRNPDQNPFFEVALTLEPQVMIDSELDWRLCQYDDGIDTKTAKFDLSIEFEERSADIMGRIEYHTDLFEKATIERLIGHFQTLLEGIVANPQARISEWALLTELEQQQLFQWNDTQADYPKDKCIHQLFEAQVETTPDAIAVVFEDQSVTYRELNQNANQLAHYLQTLGIKPEVLVGICVERSIEMVIGLLGILKAGGAYVPIDPSYPQSRIRYMLDDSAAPLLLTQSHLKAQLSVLERVVVCLHEVDLANQPTENPLNNNFATDLAYVIYTSGSTGKPKGVMIEHYSAVNLATFQHHYFHTNTDSKILQFASLSFDAATWEVLMSLCSGAALQLVPMNQIQTNLKDILQKHTITHATLPPSVVNVLSNSNLSHLKYLIVAGETCSPELVMQWAQPGQHFINAYGPTEATVCASVFECTPNGDKPPIGQPIANTRIYILDKNKQPLPIGIPGELCIAGAGLARGYLNRPELTAEKFLEIELFGKTERIYKTGDLAKWRFDGNLEYLGRIDHQVKLRGFRIELGEIEAVLTQHENVKEAVVILFDSDDNKRLVAYLTSDFEPNQLVVDVKNQLKASLPGYMIPSHFTVLDRLPLTPNGKIDRQALPAPEIKTATAKPTTPTEDLLANLWAGILKCKTISRHDNFFEIGGHSLLAFLLIARIRDSFQLELPIRAVFEHPTVSGLATAIETATGTVCLPPIEAQPAAAPKVLSFAQQRLWFLNQFEKNHSATYNMPVVLRLSGQLDVEALQQSLHWLASRHTSLRTYFPTDAGQAQVQIQAIDQIEVLKIYDLRYLTDEAQSHEVQTRTNRHAITPFDLAKGPLFKAELLQLNENQWVLLLNMHHIISDGWSWEVFYQNWQHAYTAFVQGSQPSLPKLAIQYSDYAVWQRLLLQGEVLQQQVDYWCQQLAGSPELLELPTDKPRPPQQSYQGAHYSHRLSPTLLKKVTTLSQQQGVTVFMTLLTTFFIQLSRDSRQQDLCIGTPIAGRTHSQTEHLIGLFVNTLVLRSQLKTPQSFIDLLLETRQTCLDAYAHQDIPFEMLVEQLQPTRSLSHSPLFQVMFVLQNNEPATLTLPGLDITALAPDYPIAKFDLTLNIEELDGQWHCWWEYATDLFDAETIECMARDFEVLLTAIVENPEQSIDHLPILTKNEVQQLLAWNNTATDYSKKQTIVDWQPVEKTPDNLAVVFDEQSVSYQFHVSEQTFVAPRTADEELLADIWAFVLGIERVGIHDNFFEQGGHSLSAVQLVSKIALATNISISVKQLFLDPTIAQLAILLDKLAPKHNPIEANHSTSKRKNHPISKEELILSHSSPHFQLERRSLLSLLSAQKIPPVNAAALGYLPDSILEQSDLSREEILEQWFENLPFVVGITETVQGRIALLFLPRFNSDLYSDIDDIVNVTLDALEIAGQMEASTVSLTGIIPSATDYARAIAKAMKDRRHLPQITTGHSTTTAAVVLAIGNILHQSGRSMATERVGVIGLGSIGLSSLRLMLKCLPHPVELMLCDLYAKKAFLEDIRDQIINELDFQGQIQLLFSEVELPDEIYNATLIIGATNVPEVLDINLVKPGTLIVDDSGPHCFNSELAIKRFQAHQDILLTEGGVLKSPQPIQTVNYLPHLMEKILSSQQIEEFIKLIKHNPFEITGCVFSSLLSAVENIKPTVGLVQLNDSVKHYETLIAKGFQAADLHCEDYVLPDKAISHFQKHFGHLRPH